MKGFIIALFIVVLTFVSCRCDEVQESDAGVDSGVVTDAHQVDADRVASDVSIDVVLDSDLVTETDAEKD